MANPILDQIKLSGVTYDIIDSTAIHSMDGYWTSGQTESAITAATAALAETVAEELSGKTDVSAFTAYTAATDTVLSNKADKSEIPAVSGYADSVTYNSTSKYVEFYHGGTGGTKVFEYDASPFLIDGMVDDVEIVDYQPTAPSIPQDKVKITWADGYNQTVDVDIDSIGDLDEHIYSNFVKVEFGNLTGIKTINNHILANADDCFSLTSATFVGDVKNMATGLFSAAFELNEVYFFADSPSGFTFEYGLDEGFMATVYDGCETYETTAATYPIYVPSLANYSGESLTIGEEQTTWGQWFGSRLQEIPTIKALKITFNTDAGKQDIIIPLSEIFDPSNYYTKTEVDEAISAATSGKSDVGVTVNDVNLVASNNKINMQLKKGGVWQAAQDILSADTGITIANNKISVDTTTIQEKLVSATNIKTINGTSILGSGNLEVQSLPTVSGTTLIFS